jgi:uncharacterized protein involved in exopolysaccharide biosynthesis
LPDYSESEKSVVGPTMLQLVVMILRQRQLVARVALAFTVAVLVFLVVRGRTYTSSTTFLPASAELSSSGVAGLAAQFGFSIPASVAGQSPDFYAELLQSSAILREVVSHEYEIVRRKGFFLGSDTVRVTGSLDQLLEIERSTDEESREATIRQLRDMLSVSTGRQTGTVTLKVRTPWPSLSYQIATRMMSLVEDFNLTERQSQAAAERRFIEERLELANQELQASVRQLERFLSENRSFSGSPTLTFQHDRLSQEFNLRQRIVAGLTDGYEKARIEEVRDTPLITTVEVARVPVLPDRRRALLKAAVALMGGALLGVIMAFVRESLSTSRRQDDSTAVELQRLTHELRSELRRPWRVFMASP